jgi:hypothetical protein
MEYEFTYQCPPELVKKVIRQFIVVYHGWPTIILISILGIIAIAMSLFGDLPWLSGFFVASLFFYIVPLISYYRKGIKVANELKDEYTTVKFTNDNIVFHSIDHTSIVKWSKFSQLWILRDAWLFFIYSDTQYTMVPSSCISKELGEFIMSKFFEQKKGVVRPK